ncbi:hypothetical protein GOQ27_11810 [Clostridium sp. D2Q-11]|uniref:Uncharacterized protein n=1 Tax=Anaeromonas frigoriresistens TaxID=2683708 RepID=A0A942Z7W5_9FIRM|nr:hypothetical protein [Anaeromonas frigoriresistens]MBS4539152.1 hypothetical protein [Anaeromonas frigoriresistens]
MNEIDVYSKLSELKEVDYKNTLAIASIIEVLVEKGIIQRNDISKKSRVLDSMSLEDLRILRLSKK